MLTWSQCFSFISLVFIWTKGCDFKNDNHHFILQLMLLCSYLEPWLADTNFFFLNPESQCLESLGDNSNMVTSIPSTFLLIPLKTGRFQRNLEKGKAIQAMKRESGRNPLLFFQEKVLGLK